jgi:pimeloyl-ACP methyl ester carboxylesterase
MQLIMKNLFVILIMATMTTTSGAQTAGKYATVNGLKMYYEIHGSGYPLVLIHGGGSTIESNWGRILPILAKTHKVIAMELQAHGHTPDRDKPLSFAQDADDVAELLKQLNVTRADIFGFSNGASTTLEIAIRHPELVNKIVVASTMYKKSGAYPWFWDMMEKATFEQMPEELKDAFRKTNSDKDALFTMYKRDVARMQNFTDIQEADIKAIKAPALIVMANQDVCMPEHGVEMMRQLQKATLMVLPGGHGDYIGEITTVKPGVTEYPAIKLIEDFLQEK